MRQAKAGMTMIRFNCKMPISVTGVMNEKKPGLAAPRARQLFSSAVAEIGQFTSALFCCTLVSTALF